MYSTEEFKHMLIKPTAAGAAAALIDNKFFNQRVMKENIKFGAAVGVSVLVADQMLKAAGAHRGPAKSLDGLIQESAVSITSGFLIDHYVLNKTRNDWLMRAGAVVGSILVGDLAEGFMLGYF